MNKFITILAFLLFFFFVSCESREDKIKKATAQELKGTLYDFESYEPIKTDIDSAFLSPYIDLEIKSLMFSFAKLSEDLEIAKRTYNHTLSSIASWDMPYKSAYAQYQIKKAISERDAAINDIGKIQNQLKLNIKNLYQLLNQYDSNEDKFIGWFVSQRYKCKTRGGYPTFGDDVFVFSTDMSECIFHMSGDEYDAMCDYIDRFASIPENEVIQKIEKINLMEQ